MIITITLNTTVDRTIEVDDFKPFGLNVGRLIRTLPAGKGVNVSRLLSTLGTPSIATGLVGKREVSVYEENLSGTLVETDFVELDEPTRENVTIVDPSRGETHIREEGSAVSSEHIRLFGEKLRGRIKRGDSVVFAGSLPPGVSAQDLRKMLEICSQQGAKIYLDTKGEILRACADIADVIKPNVDELREMLESSSQDINDLLAQLRKSRAGVSLVTCGADGAYYTKGDTCIHAAFEGPPFKPVSSVGCGDAFLAGFIHCIETGKTEGEALRRAVACGTACLLSPTTDINDPEISSRKV